MSSDKSYPLRTDEEGKKRWETLDEQFIKVFDASLGTYRINKHINKIIVIVGLVLIGYALIYHTYSSLILDGSNDITDTSSLVDNNVTTNTPSENTQVASSSTGGQEPTTSNTNISKPEEPVKPQVKIFNK